MKNKKKFAIASFVMALLSIIIILFVPEISLLAIKLIYIAGILVALTAIIFGFIGVKTSKGLSIAGIVISILSCVILVIFLVTIMFIEKEVKNCVDNGNNTSTCEFLGEESKFPNSWLREDQMKESSNEK